MAEFNALGWGTKNLLLLLICILASSIRLFSVVKYESVIHEFDPYFNYRVTQFLTKEGFYNLWNWFDTRTWYPLGRVVGGTVYPGLIYTAGAIHNALHYFNIPIHVQEVCVFTAPLFSAFCALATYGLVSECHSDGAGLAAAAMVATVPSYISRSVAGSYDNEGVAIFALVNVFYTFIKTVNTGSLAWGTVNLLAYFYMVLSWGGYSFIINLLPLYALVCIASGRLSGRLYLAFAPLVLSGTLVACSIPVVGFNAVLMSEHFGAFFATAVIHGALLVRFIRGLLPARLFQMAVRMVLLAGAAVLALALFVVIGHVIKSPTLGWTGRSMTLLDPTYASKFVPIIASVSEHQPTSWPSYLTDLHAATLLAPVGVIACFRNLTYGALFLVMYGVTALYFSGVMVRLMLVLAPAMCCLAGCAIADILNVLTSSVKAAVTTGAPEVAPSEPAEEEPSSVKAAAKAAGVKDKDKSKDKEKSKDKGKAKDAEHSAATALYALHPMVALSGAGLLVALLVSYVVHCVYVSADMYSAPSIVLQSGRQDGSVYVFDDFREAYAWLRHNTAPETKVASWWDYGYQTTAMANRTVIVDNNTWNTTHIATVGRAMSSPEYKAWKIYRSLDVEYVFVVFGALVGYPSDDINKFLWMVRIGGGVYPEIKEPNYLDSNGNYRIDAGGNPIMLKSLMYKLSYYDYAGAAQQFFGQYGFDRVRNTVIGNTEVSLKYFEEVFTSQHWMMRIYRVLDEPKLDKATQKKKPRRTGLVASSS